MIVADSSVWINHFRDIPSAEVAVLRSTPRLIAGDLVVLEVLRGIPDDRRARLTLEKFRNYGIVPMLGVELAIAAANNYRSLRSLGTTPKLADLIIATFCIERGHHLLHQDRDFDPFERHLGLKVFR
jgi:predicted nucleic acid-binding protein